MGYEEGSLLPRQEYLELSSVFIADILVFRKSFREQMVESAAFWQVFANSNPGTMHGS